MAAEPLRRRPRRGSLERPLSIRLYRAAWLAVAVPVLVAAFSVGRPDPLPQPRPAPFFDGPTALQLATEFARRFPDRSPGSERAVAAASWVEERFRSFGFDVERQPFSAEVPGRGREEFVNIVAVAPRSARVAAASQEVIVVTAHRDNLGLSPGATDNGSGTAALLELARNAGGASLAHTFVFVSTDGGAFGGLGAAEFASSSRFAGRVIAVVNLDEVARAGAPRITFASDNSRVPGPTLLATAEESVRRQAGVTPERASAAGQLLDLAFPFSLYEQAPFVARGVPAVTLSRGGERPPAPEGDTLEALDGGRLDALGRSGEALLAALDESAEVARGTDSYLFLGSRLVHGWTIQFVLLAALLPFLVVTVDLFARCRRRHIPLGPAVRSYLSRLGVWLWTGALFALFVFVGFLPSGADRPIAMDTEVATDWPVGALTALVALSALGWVVAHPRLVPTRTVSRPEELAGHTGRDARARRRRPGRRGDEPLRASLRSPLAARLALASPSERPRAGRAARSLRRRVRRAPPAPRLVRLPLRPRARRSLVPRRADRRRSRARAARRSLSRLGRCRRAGRRGRRGPLRPVSRSF